MIGGIVIEVIHLPDRTWVNCADTRSSDKCAIYVKRSPKSECIEAGDSFWWQSSHAMWTPLSNKTMKDARAGRHYDIRLERIGFSGVKRPARP